VCVARRQDCSWRNSRDAVVEIAPADRAQSVKNRGNFIFFVVPETQVPPTRRREEPSSKPGTWQKPKQSFVCIGLRDFELVLHSGSCARRRLQPSGCRSNPLSSWERCWNNPARFSRTEIQQRLWPHGTSVEFEHNIGAAMNRLRQVLADSAENPIY
jgi:hypothetical protein